MSDTVCIRMYSNLIADFRSNDRKTMIDVEKQEKLQEQIQRINGRMIQSIKHSQRMRYQEALLLVLFFILLIVGVQQTRLSAFSLGPIAYLPLST